MSSSERASEESPEALSPESIKDLRERLDLKQDEMAELLDVSVGTIHRWEAGKAQPRDKRMRQLQVLGQKVEEFGGEKVKNGINAWMTFAPRMLGGLAGASIEILLENSFSRWVNILQKSATQMITQQPGADLPGEDSEEENGAGE